MEALRPQIVTVNRAKEDSHRDVLGQTYNMGALAGIITGCY